MNKKIFHVHLVVMVYCNKQNVFFFYHKTPLTSDYMFYIYLTLDIVWIFITTFYTKCGEASDSLHGLFCPHWLLLGSNWFYYGRVHTFLKLLEIPLKYTFSLNLIDTTNVGWNLFESP